MPALLSFCVSAILFACSASAADEGWLRGRTSWYGEPEWVEPFVETRGGGRSAFGVLEWGACGYTNGDGEIMTAKETAAAYSDDNPDYAGSCGRCYEVRCVDGPVIGKKDPIPLEELYYFPEFANPKDELGRDFPGNPTEDENYYTVTCYNNDPYVVKIIDACPCVYCPAGQECRYQESCCVDSIDHPKAGQPALDVSFWAFQQMAHPSYGVMMVDYRPVDCVTREPLQFVPGFISRTLYSDMVGEGWSWFASRASSENGNNNNFYVRADGEGVGGSAAACAEIYEGLAMTFWSRGAGIPSFEPFSNVEAISFWIKNKADPGASLPIRLIVSGDQTKPSNSPTPLPGEPEPIFCDAEVFLSEREPDETAEGGYLKFVISMGDFGCEPDEIKKLNKIDFLALSNTEFCVDELQLL